MVWFQCEDCGDNLKKPKLPNHFRSCSARKLSCIDCGQTFGQESVQGHTQCITEAEKYGPKGEGQASNGKTPTSNKASKQQPNVDINVGLSERPPWFCSLCNTSATSKQTLLLHAEGKKHRAKARAFHAANGQSKQLEVDIRGTMLPTENATNGEVPENKHVEEPKMQDSLKVDTLPNSLKSENGTLALKKKRKLDTENDDSGKKPWDTTPTEGGDGEVIMGEKSPGSEIQPKKYKMPESKNTRETIKWKKLITSTLKSSPDGVMKMKKLRKLVLKALRESGITVDEAHFAQTFEHKVNSGTRFSVEKKYVKLTKG